jgi:hypothetical protein
MGKLKQTARDMIQGHAIKVQKGWLAIFNSYFQLFAFMYQHKAEAFDFKRHFLLFKQGK